MERIGSKIKKPLNFITAFGTYKADKIIGEGGAGRVYLARDEAGEEWAIKVLDPNKATKEKLKRFKNEYLFCSRNQHENIITVHDYGLLHEEEGTSMPFYVMPKYDKSLRELIAPKMQNDLVLFFLGQILDGVEAAHLKGVIHRDLKPENILYDSKQNVLVIADFGIARFSEEELFTDVQTAVSTRLANFLYAAPEQRKPGLSVDRRADIYAIGLILNEMFTGEIPQGTDFKTITSVDDRYGYLDTIVSTMIKQDPDNRYATIDEIKRELIARNNDFIKRQKLSELKRTVLTESEIDDPLIEYPPIIFGADWENNQLTITLSQNVNQTWVWAFQNMGSHTAVMGRGPEMFRISGNKAIITAYPDEAERIIGFFKEWLTKANKAYEHKIRSDKRQAEEEERLNLQQKIKQEELNKEIQEKILKKIKE